MCKSLIIVSLAFLFCSCYTSKLPNKTLIVFGGGTPGIETKFEINNRGIVAKYLGKDIFPLEEKRLSKQEMEELNILLSLLKMNVPPTDISGNTYRAIKIYNAELEYQSVWEPAHLPLSASDAIFNRMLTILTNNK